MTRIVATAFILIGGASLLPAGEFNDVIYRKGETIDNVLVVDDTLYQVGYRKTGMTGAALKFSADTVDDIEYGSGPDEYRRGVAAARQNNFASAIETLEDVLKKNANMDPKVAQWVKFYLGKSYCGRQGAGDYEKALDQFKAILAAANDGRFLPDAHLYIGHCHKGMRNFDQAANAYREGANAITTLAAKAGAKELKSWILEKAQECRMNVGEAFEKKADAAQDPAEKKNGYTQALTEYTSLARDTGLARSIQDELELKRAKVLFELDQRTEARDLLEALIARAESGGSVDEKTVGQAYFLLGSFYWKLGKKGEEDAAAALARDQKRAHDNFLREAYDNYQRSLFNQKRVTVRFLGNEVYVAYAHYFSGNCYEALGRLQTADRKEEDWLKMALWHYGIVRDQYSKTPVANTSIQRIEVLKSVMGG